MAMQIQDPMDVPGGVSATKNKFPWMIMLGGCGCLTVVLVIVAGVIGFFAIGKAKSTFSEFSEFSESYDVTSTLEGGGVAGGDKASSKGGAAESGGGDAKRGDSQARALEPAKVREYMSKPLTKAEISDFHKSAAAWKKNKVFVEYESNLAELQKLEKKDNKSAVEQMRAVRNVGKAATSLAKLSTAFDEHVAKHGGYEAHFSRVLRIAGAVAATEMMAKQHKLEDKHADRAIELVLKEQPEIAAEYKKGVQEAKASAGKGGDGNFEAYTAVMSGGPGAIAMARMPAATFKTWQSLSSADRKKAEEELTSALGMSSYLGLGLHPMMIFQGAMMSELQEITE